MSNYAVHLQNQVNALTAEVERLHQAILDIDAHATPLGEDDDGFVTGGYVISVGSLHRALGKVGHTAPKCEAEAEVERLQAERDDRIHAQAEAYERDLERLRGERDVAVATVRQFTATLRDTEAEVERLRTELEAAYEACWCDDPTNGTLSSTHNRSDHDWDKGSSEVERLRAERDAADAVIRRTVPVSGRGWTTFLLDLNDNPKWWTPDGRKSEPMSTAEVEAIRRARDRKPGEGR